ncbi:MAG TPA: HDOD domain-containing protein [Bryobacterales bacterium]|nr:HDOD domain-containing protein [Bryobacterales bacterium]
MGPIAEGGSRRMSTGMFGPAPSVSAEQIEAALANLRQLPASEPVVHRALAQLDGCDFIVAELKETLLSDAALAARILRLANSAFFGFRSEVRTMSQAIVLLGQNRLRTLLHRILADKIWTALGQERIAAAPLRTMSLATATAACTLSQLLLRENAEEMLLAGLLHNIGELFLLSQFQAEYLRMIALAGELGLRRAAAQVFGPPPEICGKLLLEIWGFPRLYSAIVEHMDCPLDARRPAEYASAIVLVHAARRMAEPFVAGSDAAEAIRAVPSEVCDELGLQPDLLAEVFQTLPHRMSLEQLQAAR